MKKTSHTITVNMDEDGFVTIDTSPTFSVRGGRDLDVGGSLAALGVRAMMNELDFANLPARFKRKEIGLRELIEKLTGRQSQDSVPETASLLSLLTDISKAKSPSHLHTNEDGDVGFFKDGTFHPFEAGGELYFKSCHPPHRDVSAHILGVVPAGATPSDLGERLFRKLAEGKYPLVRSSTPEARLVYRDALTGDIGVLICYDEMWESCIEYIPAK